MYLYSAHEAHILPAALLADINLKQANHVLIPLRLRSRNATRPGTQEKVLYPQGEDYLNSLQVNGHQIASPIVLCAGRTPHAFALNLNAGIPGYQPIANTGTPANNEMREMAKSLWKWH